MIYSTTFTSPIIDETYPYKSQIIGGYKLINASNTEINFLIKSHGTLHLLTENISKKMNYASVTLKPIDKFEIPDTKKGPMYFVLEKNSVTKNVNEIDELVENNSDKIVIIDDAILCLDVIKIGPVNSFSMEKIFYGVISQNAAIRIRDEVFFNLLRDNGIDAPEKQIEDFEL